MFVVCRPCNHITEALSSNNNADMDMDHMMRFSVCVLMMSKDQFSELYSFIMSLCVNLVYWVYYGWISFGI